MIVDLDFPAMIRRIGPAVADWSEEIVPDRVELVPNNRYSAQYAWMYSYERSLRSRIEKGLGKPLGEWEKRLFGDEGAVSESLSNAFVHGHRRDGRQVIGVRCAVGRSGVALVIRDGGRGFDVKETLQRLDRSGTYFHLAGNGIRLLARSSHVLASFSGGGTEVCLAVEFKGVYSPLPLTPPASAGAPSSFPK